MGEYRERDHLEQYLEFSRKHPEMFVNAPSGGIDILLDEGEIREAEAQALQWLKEGQPKEWAQVGIAYRDPHIFLLRDAVRFPDKDKSLGTYFRLVGDDEPPGVVILPTYQGRVLLLRHFRHATRKWHLEIPRGFGLRGFSAEENASRELFEECQGIISRLVPLGSAYPNTGATAECNEFFFAELVSYGPVDTREGISGALQVTIAEFENLIREHSIDDEFTIVAYARAKLQGML